MSESTRKHKSTAPQKLKFGIFICSTSRYKQQKNNEPTSDISGDLIESLLAKTGHVAVFRRIISDDKKMIEGSLKEALALSDLDAIIFCGGTGITHTDVTIETVTPFMEKTLPGFGEIFRRLSFDQTGSAAILSRATAGTSKGKAVFCIPGSPDAVRLCLEKLILPEAGHVVRHARE